MKFIEVKEVPRKLYRIDLQNHLEEFMRMNVKIVKVDFNEREYKSAETCRTSFLNAIKRGAFPIDVKCVNKEIYLVRRDM